MFPPDNLRAVFQDGTAILFGEGYGAKIQKGGNYIPDGQSFILFDVWRDIWLERINVADIAGKLGIKIVPIVGEGTLLEGVEFVKHATAAEFRSDLAENKAYQMEGLVMRPAVEMQDRRGNRIIAKIKRRDYTYNQGG